MFWFLQCVFAAGQIWAWAGPGALTSRRIINGLREIKNDILQAELAKLNSKLQSYWAQAQQKLAGVLTLSDDYEDFVESCNIVTLRSLSRYVHYFLHQKSDVSALQLKDLDRKGKKAKIAELLAIHFENSPQLRPICIAGTWQLPACATLTSSSLNGGD